MSEEKKIFIINFLNKAEDTLLDAKINLENNRINNALNRIYYAVFYSVVALGYLEGFITSKHKQLLGWFNKNFIHEKKIFDIEMYEFYRAAYKNRHEVDYTFLSNVTKTEALEYLEMARLFISKVKDYVEKQIKTMNLQN